MSRAISALSSLVVLFLFTSVATPLIAQDRIEESRGRVYYRGVLLQLNQRLINPSRLLGRPIKKVSPTISVYRGLTVETDRGQRVVAIELSQPFTGATEMRYKIGAPIKIAAARDPRLKGARAGWKLTGRIYVHVAAGQVTKLRIGKAPTGFVAKKPAAGIKKPIKKPVKKPTGTPLGRKPSPGAKKPASKKPVARNPGAKKPGTKPSKLQPNPQRNPKHTGKKPNTAQPQKDEILVWKQEWRADRQGGRWQKSPVNRWPTNEGLLLVRVAFGRGVSACEQLFCDYDLARTPARDYVYRPDIVQRKRKSGTPLRWQWRAKGQGKIKVKILWFRTKQRLQRYQRDNPYAERFAFRAPNKPWRQQVNLVWEHSWNTNGEARLIRGPKESWPDKSGTLLIRAFGGPQITSFIYRAGVKSAVEVPLGDHALPVQILDRAKKNNLLGGLFGDDRKRLHFGFRGHGPVKVMLYWLPDARYVDTYCAECTHDSINPWRRTAALNPFSWIFGGPANWRNDSQYEADWRAPVAPVDRQFTNVASRANGAFIRRSSRNRRLSRGSEFDGGVWYSNDSRYAFSESRFSGHVHLDRIEIGSAGSDFDAARYIVVELEKNSGGWDRVATFHNENINWHRLGGGRQGVSRPRISIPIDARESYRALRVVFTGHGPFRMAGIRAIGRFHGDRSFEDPPPLVESARFVRIDAAQGWTDTGGDVEAGRSLLVDINGTWSVDPTDNGQFGWSGPEGIAALALRSFFSTAAAHESYRSRLPAPDLAAGSLIARIGLNGPPILVTPGRPIIFNESGHLYLGINDESYRDNRGILECTIVGAFFPHNAPQASVPDVVEVRVIGVVRSVSLNRPISGVDVFAQLEPWPRTIFGGARTDGQGRFDFKVLVPRGQPLVIGAPEFKIESTPKSFGSSGEFQFDLQLN